jgi:ribokinase
MMYDVITIGSATVDIFMKSPHFHLQPTQAGVLLCEEYGAKLDVDQFEMTSGGAGTNTAVGFARLGLRAAAVVEIGKDTFGQVVWDDLKREHVDTEFVITEKSEQTAVSVLLISGEGGRSALTHRGASSLLEARDLPWQALHETRWIHLSNVSGNKELLLRLFDHLQNATVGLSWNPGLKELELLAKKELLIPQISCDIVILNKEEWQVLAPVQAELLEHVPYVVVTDGSNGGQVFVHGAYEMSYTSDHVKTVQETGAGDAFCVGFVWAHLQGKQIAECVHWGVREAGSVIQHMGAKKGLLSRQELGLHI